MCCYYYCRSLQKNVRLIISITKGSMTMDQTCSASSGPAGLVVQVCFPGVRAAVMDNLNRQRLEGRLCDLSIQVQGQVFRAHRCVLAASSPYFHDQVLLKNVTTVSLPSVMDPVAFESVLSSAYTGQLSILHDDIVNYVTVASFLQMWHIVDKCTEILKRPRPPTESNTVDAAGTHHGASSRQQSPSSTDCLYVEREGRRKERKPDALPPLATWRRPQEFPRWSRPRPSPAPQHLADSQLDALPGCGESDYSSCEEVWQSSHVKGSPFGHDVHGHNSGRPHGGLSVGEALRQRARYHHRGPGPSSERPLGKDRESAESDETREKRRNEKRGIEADEGIGEEVSEKREGLVQTGPSGHFHPGGGNPSEEAAEAAGKMRAEDMTEKAERETGGVVPTSDVTVLHACETDDRSVPGPSCPVPASSTRTQWQAGPWSQQGARSQDRAEVNYRKDECEEEEEDVDFGRFADGPFGGDTYDEIEDGTGQVSQRPLVPASPDESDFSMGVSEISWPSTSMGQARAPTPSSSRHLSPPSAPFPPPPPSSSPPTPSSSSSLSLAGTPYTGKVHFCHCGKAYTLKSMRDRHVKMQHLNLRPFGCPVCAKSFKMKHHLTKHLKTHGGLRPYECGLCGKKVVWRDSFLRHQARCERLAATSSANSGTAATDVGDGYGYGFDGGAFLAAGGQVKVEQVDFHRDMEDEMGGLLGGVPGIVDQLGTQSRSLNCQVFKQEASESFS